MEPDGLSPVSYRYLWVQRFSFGVPILTVSFSLFTLRVMSLYSVTPSWISRNDSSKQEHGKKNNLFFHKIKFFYQLVISAIL